MTKNCVAPELLVIPVPSNVSTLFTVIVNGLEAAFAVNATPLTAKLVSLGIEIPAVLDRSKVAVSDAVFGTVPELQLLPVFQSFEAGLCFQVPLPAKAGAANRKQSATRAEKRPIGVGFFMGLEGDERSFVGFTCVLSEIWLEVTRKWEASREVLRYRSQGGEDFRFAAKAPLQVC